MSEQAQNEPVVLTDEELYQVVGGGDGGPGGIGDGTGMR